MFVCIMDFKISTTFLEPIQIIRLLNESINIFDDITDKYDVFRVKTKINESYMIVAGLNNQSHGISDGLGSLMVDTIILKNWLCLLSFF